MAEDCGCGSTPKPTGGADTTACCDNGPAEPTTTSPCCGGAPSEAPFEYGSQEFEIGIVDSEAGPVPRVSSELTSADRAGARRVRWNVGRSSYRVRPGLYALGDPGAESPVLVTANYKLTFDRVRSTIAGRDVWILVLDTKGINVWCAAGKGTFGTMELITQVITSGLDLVVSHRKLIVPQLGATGVAARHVEAASGFRVVWGPVDIADLESFLDAGGRATEEMRRVRFRLSDRAVLIPVELSVVWRPWALLAAAGVVAAIAVAMALGATSVAEALLASAVAVVTGAVAGTVVVPLLLPWLPGRAFALKGAVAGFVLGLALALVWPASDVLLSAGMIALASAVSSFAAMNFTGSSTYTSPSGVEWEMRRSIPLQAAGVAAWLVAVVAWLAVVA
jgi:acetyl-CoA decarbonylase/synthase complex subunit gamma